MASPTDWLAPGAIALIELALEEDLGRGDLTTEAVIAPSARGRARIVAREPVVVAGLAVATEVFRRVDPGIVVEALVADGAAVPAGGTLLTAVGSARGLLRAERTALNFLQRLSGIATRTQAFVQAAQATAAAGSKTRIADTRKTYPGARMLEKMAVRAGGGANHRFDLGSGVLIKDNHLAIAGSVGEAVRRARALAPHGFKIEVEVDTLAQLDEALAAAADVILLDNFDDAGVAAALTRVARANPRPLIEVSGGVTLERIGTLAAAGVDIVSVGGLTHSARAVDLSLELDLDAPVA